MARRGRLTFPVVGVAKSGWSREQIIERARTSMVENGPLDSTAFSTLADHLRYIDGNYADSSTFLHLSAEVGTVRSNHATPLNARVRC